MATLEPIGCTEYTAHKEREILRLKVNEIIEALNDISVNNAKITLKQGSAVKGNFTLNQSEDKLIELDAGGSAGGFVWGEGTGTITAQTDLVNYIAEEIVDEADLREESDDALTLAINTLDGEVVKKTAIATAFEATPSNEKVPSEKLVYDNLVKRSSLTYTSTSVSGVTFNTLNAKRNGNLLKLELNLSVSNAISRTVIASPNDTINCEYYTQNFDSNNVSGRIEIDTDGDIFFECSGAISYFTITLWTVIL